MSTNLHITVIFVFFPQVQHYYRNVHAVVFVYDVTNQGTFDNMPSWIEECDRHSLTKDLPRILVGNKCDMKDSIVVNTHHAQRFADSHNMPLFETSAKDDSQNNHVESIFMTLAHKLRNAKHMMPPEMSGCGYAEESSKTVNINRSHSSRDTNVDGGGCAC